ncbi:hypothetical protein [Brachybacterium timonense]|uniref:hypothetical protein n=1 Tax=Brachybacterium timonense TaxID=2050896 RepID=UPI000D0B72E2|nr:hypothetical protein [Brachybacterium timonense]
MSATGLHDLPRLAGTWVGEAEVIMPERHLRLRHHEKVETLVGGHVVTIHGWSESEDGGPAPAFEAFAVLTCDADRGPLFVAHREDQRLEAPLEIADGRYGWTTPTPGGDVRYTASFDDAQWEETGVHVPSGQVVFRIRLRREANA